MRTNMLGDSGPQGITGYQTLDATCRQAVEVTAAVDLLSAAIADEQRASVVFALGELLFYTRRRVGADKNWSIFLALPTDHEPPPLQIYVVTVEADQLRNTQP